MTPTRNTDGNWELFVNPDWPGFAGHFPGNPILPAAEIIDLVGQTLGVGTAELMLARFVLPVVPGERLHWPGHQPKETQSILRVQVQRGDTMVAELRWRR